MDDNRLQGERIWSKDAKFALKLNKLIVWPMGLWPLESDGWFTKTRTAIAFLSQLWMVYIQSMAAYLKCGNASDIVDFVMMAVCAVMALAKIVAFRVHMGKLRTVFTAALDDWLTDSSDKTREITLPFAKTGRTVFFFQMVSCYVSNTIICLQTLPFLMPPIANGTSWNETLGLRTRQLPLKTGCMFAHYRDEIYGFLYVVEGITINTTAHGNVSCDVVLFSLAMHLCGQIEVLKKDILEFGTVKEEFDQCHRRIIGCIQRHCQLLDLAKLLNETVSGVLVVQLMLNAGMNLMLGLRMIMALESGQPLNAVRPTISFNVLMLQLYMFSYASDRLSQQAESILNALYDSNWYELPAKLRKNLYFVALRTNQPIYLTAGSFYTMNIENFKNILKASFSYFSILRVMFDG